MDYFYDLNVNTIYEGMLNEIGKPNGAIGSGITMPYYKTGDQYVAIWFACDEDVGDIPLKE